MNIEKHIKAEYRKNKNKGQKPFLKVTDAVLLTVIGYIAIFLALSEKVKNSIAALILSACATAIAVLGIKIKNDILLESYIKKERLRIKKELTINRLMVLQDKDFCNVVNELISTSDSISGCEQLTVFAREYNSISTELVSSWLRKAAAKNKSVLIIVSPSAEIENKSMLEELFNIRIFVINQEMLCDYCIKNSPISDKEADEYFLKKQKAAIKNKIPILKRLKFRGRQTRFIWLGIVLFALSFIMNMSIYYRTLGFICFWSGFYLSISEKYRQ